MPKSSQFESISDPIERFNRLQSVAKDSEPLEATAMTLATSDASGRPNARIVLLKGADERGFVFYTNYQSTKGSELEDNPQATLCFHWASLEQQVRIYGTVTKVSAAESDAYFASRPRGSQLGAIASAQSTELDARDALQERVATLTQQYEGADVPRPAHWGGYRLDPKRIEFWFGRPDRLHDREVFERQASTWKMCRLNP